jgi:hypothetical protein
MSNQSTFTTEVSNIIDSHFEDVLAYVKTFLYNFDFDPSPLSLKAATFKQLLTRFASINRREDFEAGLSTPVVRVVNIQRAPFVVYVSGPRIVLYGNKTAEMDTLIGKSANAAREMRDCQFLTPSEVRCTFKPFRQFRGKGVVPVSQKVSRLFAVFILMHLAASKQLELYNASKRGVCSGVVTAFCRTLYTSRSYCHVLEKKSFEGMFSLFLTCVLKMDDATARAYLGDMKTFAPEFAMPGILDAVNAELKSVRDPASYAAKASSACAPKTGVSAAVSTRADPVRASSAEAQKRQRELSHKNAVRMDGFESDTKKLRDMERDVNTLKRALDAAYECQQQALNALNKTLPSLVDITERFHAQKDAESSTYASKARLLQADVRKTESMQLRLATQFDERCKATDRARKEYTEKVQQFEQFSAYYQTTYSVNVEASETAEAEKKAEAERLQREKAEAERLQKEKAKAAKKARRKNRAQTGENCQYTSAELSHINRLSGMIDDPLHEQPQSKKSKAVNSGSSSSCYPGTSRPLPISTSQPLLMRENRHVAFSGVDTTIEYPSSQNGRPSRDAALRAKKRTAETLREEREDAARASRAIERSDRRRSSSKSVATPPKSALRERQHQQRQQDHDTTGDDEQKSPDIVWLDGSNPTDEEQHGTAGAKQPDPAPAPLGGESSQSCFDHDSYEPLAFTSSSSSDSELDTPPIIRRRFRRKGQSTICARNAFLSGDTLDLPDARPATGLSVQSTPLRDTEPDQTVCSSVSSVLSTPRSMLGTPRVTEKPGSSGLTGIVSDTARMGRGPSSSSTPILPDLDREERAPVSSARPASRGRSNRISYRLGSRLNYMLPSSPEPAPSNEQNRTKRPKKRTHVTTIGGQRWPLDKQNDACTAECEQMMRDDRASYNLCHAEGNGFMICFANHDGPF